ncbi:phage tail protein [Citrobacter freundii complex sp. CFNIH9]|uniref:phage tail protein n=1 Tax=Citrobacter freundii complex sp. CFNIH9 TaxID=2077149 RepID=UPI001F32B738|nr:phage tail protein [Citrobacter freundii complex sp. CFNIH9]
MADYYSIITNRGKELEAEALASGRLIVLTHFVVGDSNGKQVKPDPSQILLINETYRGDIAELVVSPEQSTQLMAKIVLPTGVGGFTVREVGLMTDAGELYAVANCPSIDKPVGGVSVNMQFRLAVSDTSNITLNVATGDGLFLRIDQNLKEIKARGAEAQKTSRESIGVLDGTTQQRGLVQLNSAVNSTSETQAATPAAVKIAIDNANARLAKDRNGGDIPNVALFLQNLGLVETINRAAGSLQKDQNGADVPQPDRFVRNIGAARAFSGGISIGGGGNWTTAEFIVWLETQGAFNHPYWMCKGSWSYGDNRTITDTGCGNIQLAGAVVEVMGDRGAMTIRVTTATTGEGALSAQFTYINHGDGYLPGWRRDLKRSGDTMSGELKIPGANALRIFNAQFGLIFRRTEEYLHLIPTLENQGETGDIGPLRPLSINLRTGEISMSHKLLASGGAQINGALGIGIESALGGNSIVLGDGDTGFKQNGDGVLDAYSDSRQVMRIVPGGVQVFGSTGSWIYMREQTCFSSVAPVDKDGASAIVRQEHPDRHFILGGLGNHQFGIYMINKSRSENGTDGQAYLDENGDWVSGGRIIPGSYENFDARYQPRGNYATQEWVLQNFVQNIRVSAPQERKFWDGAK